MTDAVNRPIPPHHQLEFPREFQTPRGHRSHPLPAIWWSLKKAFSQAWMDDQHVWDILLGRAALSQSPGSAQENTHQGIFNRLSTYSKESFLIAEC